MSENNYSLENDQRSSEQLNTITQNYMDPKPGPDCVSEPWRPKPVPAGPLLPKALRWPSGEKGMVPGCGTHRPHSFLHTALEEGPSEVGHLLKVNRQPNKANRKLAENLVRGGHGRQLPGRLHSPQENLMQTRKNGRESVIRPQPLKMTALPGYSC